MQNAAQKNQKEIFEDFYIGVYDTPKKLNRSDKKIPLSIIQMIEGGNTSIEMIEGLSKQFPTFIYKTCITIHGIFETNTTGVGGYKNLRLNQNGSLEVLYSAIDNQKIRVINEYFRALLKSGIQTNSKGHYKSKRFNDVNSANEYIRKMKALQGICMTVQGFRYFGLYYVELYIYSIKETAIPSFLEALTGLSIAELNEKKELFAIEQAEAQKRIEKKVADKETAKQLLIDDIVKLGLKPMTSIEIGKTYVRAMTGMDGIAKYYFRTFEKSSFGRFKETRWTQTDLNASDDRKVFKPSIVKPSDITKLEWFVL